MTLQLILVEHGGGGVSIFEAGHMAGMWLHK